MKNKLRYELDKRRWRKNQQSVAASAPWQSVATIDRTLDALLEGQSSLCRFGDGEYKVMAGGENGFQQENALLAQRLRQVLKSCDQPGLLVCIPNVKEDMALRTVQARQFWESFIAEHGASWAALLQPDGQYYNAHVTRLYMDYRECGRSADWFARLKGLWQGKNLLIVEGEKTRLGVGNDLFSGAESIKRVLCPSKNAFSHYDEILSEVKRLWQGELVLIALGQTATVLAHDLHAGGIRALDIGHIDIEYEWFLAGAAEKTAVAGKFVKEVDSQLAGEDDSGYLAQIAAKVGVE